MSFFKTQNSRLTSIISLCGLCIGTLHASQAVGAKKKKSPVEIVKARLGKRNKDAWFVLGFSVQSPTSRSIEYAKLKGSEAAAKKIVKFVSVPVPPKDRYTVRRTWKVMRIFKANKEKDAAAYYNRLLAAALRERERGRRNGLYQK